MSAPGVTQQSCARRATHVFLWCALAHILLARGLAGFWVVPDLTLVGMVIGISYAPQRWMVFAVTSGVLMMLWAVRWAGAVLIGYAAAGAAVRLAAARWDAGDVRVHGLLAAAGCAALSVMLVTLDDAWSFRLAMWVVGRVTLTSLAVSVVARLCRLAVEASGSYRAPS